MVEKYHKKSEITNLHSCSPSLAPMKVQGHIVECLQKKNLSNKTFIFSRELGKDKETILMSEDVLEIMKRMKEF